MIGLGICKRIESDQPADRFFHVEKEWKRFIDQAIIIDQAHIQGQVQRPLAVFRLTL